MNMYPEQHPANVYAAEPARPQFLSVLCVLTFIWSGLVILTYGALALCLTFDPETSNLVIEKMQESNPSITINDPEEFIRNIGMVGLIGMLAKIFTLTGAIMMWRLNKIGFIIYVVAELSTYFFGLDLNAKSEEGSSAGMLIFTIFLDVLFIGLYAMNLKHMNKNTATNNTL